MKLLVVCSSLDLGAPFSATPAWWQLLKGLHEVGVELVVTTYHGRTPRASWWRSYPNPTHLEGDLFALARRTARLIRGATAAAEHEDAGGQESLGQRGTRRMAQIVIAPRWRRHLTRILKAEPDVDAVLLLSVPPNHFRGVAGDLRTETGRPVIFYDGDVPASLPRYQGFASGFRIYHGADLSEFDAVIGNSIGGAKALLDLGARRVHTLHFAADPEVYAPMAVRQAIDVFFYGHTLEYRRDWAEAMLAVPSDAMPSNRFAMRGVGLGAIRHVEEIPYLDFKDLPGCIARSRINLVIARRPHASVYGSSTMRPFELAMMGACMVSNPILGVEEWFEPGRELIVVHSAEEAIDRYRFLLSHDSDRVALGASARKRALAEHTYRHRATHLVHILEEYL